MPSCSAPTADRSDFELDSATVRRHRRADGSDVLVNVYGNKLDYQNRTALLCSIIDVTERVRAEEERDRNREFLDRVIDNVSMTILVKDARTLRYVLANRAAERLWGFSRSEMVGKTPHEVFDTETAELVEANDRKLLESGTSFYLPEHRVETRNGPRIVTSNRIAVRNQSGEVQYVLGVVEDVTERKQLDDQLRQAQKMEAVGNLTGGIAHDFNNLLTVIIGNLDLLREDVAGHVEAEQKIDTIAQAAERGADLTRHMLVFSRRQPLQAEEIDVNTLIAGTTRLLSRALGGNIAVTLRTGADLPPVLVDSAQLETALLNIAINARDAMPAGGALTIATRLAHFDAEYAAHNPEVAAGAYVLIAISDTGTGIPPDVVERIFEPFFTTKPRRRAPGSA